MSFGAHVDNAIRPLPGSPRRIRTDLSATLFLNAPEDYDGGELLIEDTYGAHEREAARRRHDPLSRDQPAPRRAGDARRAHRRVLLDPEHGARTTASARLLVRSRPRDRRARPAARRIIPPLAQLTAVYHNLVRKWGEV